MSIELCNSSINLNLKVSATILEMYIRNADWTFTYKNRAENFLPYIADRSLTPQASKPVLDLSRSLIDVFRIAISWLLDIPIWIVGSAGLCPMLEIDVCPCNLCSFHRMVKFFCDIEGPRQIFLRLVISILSRVTAIIECVKEGQIGCKARRIIR
jgi:hypothetical protein